MQQQHKQDDPIQRRKEGDTSRRESVGQHVEADTARVVEEAQEEVAAARRPWHQTLKWGVTLLFVYAVLLVLFGILAWEVYVHPVLATDVTITHLFQEDQSPWLRMTMLAVSAIGNIQLLSAGLVVLVALIFWLVDLRLEAIMIVAVSVTSGILNALIKSLVARPRPTSHLVDIISFASRGQFPQWACHVVCGILGAAILLRTHPLQGALLVAYHTPDCFRTAGGAGWPLACLPGYPLDQRCPGRLPVGRCVSGYLAVDLSLFERTGHTCPKAWQNHTPS